MVKLYSTNFSYDYPLPAVSLAYFLRYPNPYSTHVLSTDVIERFIDPVTKRLHTTRLHLKKSRIPSAVLRLLPRGILGGGAKGGESQSFILETSVVDVREGWMEAESRNMEWTGILSVIERQRYTRPPADPHRTPTKAPNEPASGGLLEATKNENTNVAMTVTFKSRFGQAKALNRRVQEAELATDSKEAKRGFFSTWSTAAMQRTIEATGMQRTRKAMVNSKEGMNVVLQRMRAGGLGAVLDGMRRDREEVMESRGTMNA